MPLLRAALHTALPRVLVALCLLPTSAAQEARRDLGEALREGWRWAHWTTEDGLPHSRIEHLVETPTTTWAGTRAGLAYFDGWEWITDNLPKAPVVNLSSDDTGQVWVVTDSTTWCGSEFRLEPVQLPSSFAGLHLESLAHTPQGRLALLIDPAGPRRLFLWDEAGTRELFVEGGAIAEIVQTESRRVFVSGSTGIFVWQPDAPGGFEPFLEEGEGRLSRPGALAENHDGFGVSGADFSNHQRGIWSWDAKGKTNIRDVLGGDTVQLAGISATGTAVVVLDTREVRVHEARVQAGETWPSIRPTPAPLVDAIFLRFRENGDLWVGTDDGLWLLRASARRWSTWRFPDQNDPRNRVQDLLLSRDGKTLWIASVAGVHARRIGGVDEGELLPVPRFPIPELPYITGLAEDAEGRIWTCQGGSLPGAFRLDGDTWTHVTEDATGTPLGLIHKIRSDRRGRLWFLGLSSDPRRRHERSGALHVLEAGRLTAWDHGGKLDHNRLYDFYEDGAGAYWFGTLYGVHRFWNGVWTSWEAKSSDDDRGKAFRLIGDGEGGVWVAGQQRGLRHIDAAGTESQVELQSSLPTDVWDLCLDDQGVLWATTEYGLAALRGTDAGFLGPGTGLPSPRLWPVILQGERVITGSSGGGTHLLWRDEESGPGLRVEIRSSVEGDRANLRWAVRSFEGSQPAETIDSRYRIDGGAWSEWSRARELVLDGLSPGSHRFEVQGKGLFGTLSPIADVELSAPTPFYLEAVFLFPVVFSTLSLVVVASTSLRRRRRDAQALRLSEAEHRLLMEQSSDAILLCDRHGRCLRWNPPAAALLAARGAELTGLEVEQALAERAETGARLELRDVLAGQTKTVELALRDAGSHKHVLETVAKRLDDGRVQITMRDISERRLLEEASSRFLRQETEAQRVESLARMAGGVAHDFNNLLMVILGNVDEAAQAMSPASPGVTKLQRAMASVHRASDLTRQLLTYAGRGDVQHESLELNALLAELANHLRGMLDPGTTLRFELGQGLPAIQGDASRIRQAVLNLVVNANDAIKGAEGLIEIRTELVSAPDGPPPEPLDEEFATPLDWVVLRVRDNGVGMSVDTLSRIFDPFFTTKLVGRGLGLAAVQGTARVHGGQVEVRSELGRGTTFSIFLPASPIVATSKATHAPVVDGGRSETILIIDDNLGVREILGAMLTRMGYRVIKAESGELGLEIFAAHTREIDCVIVDLALPGMEGTRVRQELLELRADARVVLMSGDGEKATRIANDASAFLGKPFSVGELRACLKKVMGAAAAETQRSPMSSP